MTDQKSLPKIYVAGPFRGENAWVVENNIREAEQIGFAVARFGGNPLIPHTMFRYWDGTLTDEFWLRATKEWLRVCDAAVFSWRWESSVGSRGEYEEAGQLKIPTLVLESHNWTWALEDWMREELNRREPGRGG